MSLIVYRLHEWCARHIKGVQYPAPLSARVAPQSAIHWEVRMLLVVFAMVAIPVGFLGLFFAGLMLWAIVTQ